MNILHDDADFQNEKEEIVTKRNSYIFFLLAFVSFAQFSNYYFEIIVKSWAKNKIVLWFKATTYLIIIIIINLKKTKTKAKIFTFSLKLKMRFQFIL